MISAARVILITVAGPAGQVDVAVRSDVTPAVLAAALGGVITRAAAVAAEHLAPPRPGQPAGHRAPLGLAVTLGEAGVADGDVVLVRDAGHADGDVVPLRDAGHADGDLVPLRDAGHAGSHPGRWPDAAAAGEAPLGEAQPGQL